MRFFKEFQEHGRFVKSLNATFVVLIPKKGGAEDLKDFRPISLVGGLYKWLAKVLANRFKVVLPKVISKNHNTFIGSIQILDVALVANEAIDSIVRRESCVVLCKLDLEKAYDHVDFFLFFQSWQKWVLVENG